MNFGEHIQTIAYYNPNLSVNSKALNSKENDMWGKNIIAKIHGMIWV
jgi:hypothetical protein